MNVTTLFGRETDERLRRILRHADPCKELESRLASATSVRLCPPVVISIGVARHDDENPFGLCGTIEVYRGKIVRGLGEHRREFPLKYSITLRFQDEAGLERYRKIAEAAISKMGKTRAAR